MSRTPAEGSTPEASPIRLQDLETAELVERHPGRNRNKADVLVCRLAGQLVAVKDYRPRPWWVRNSVGRFLIRREAKAYRAAAGAEGVPRYLGRLGPFTLATEFVEARTLATCEAGAVPGETFDRLKQVVDGLHRRGVAVADLNYRDVLLTPDDRVFVIDLAMAWVLGRRPGRLRRRIYEHFRVADLFSLARLRARFTGEDQTVAVADADPSAVAWHRFARRLKWRWDRLRGAERLPPVNDHWRL